MALNTPQPMLESFNSFLKPYYVSTDIILARRGEVVPDCPVRKDRPKVKTIQPVHHTELQEERDRRPTMREPLKTLGTEDVKEEEDEEEEEEEKEGNQLLSYFP